MIKEIIDGIKKEVSQLLNANELKEFEELTERPKELFLWLEPKLKHEMKNNQKLSDLMTDFSFAIR